MDKITAKTLGAKLDGVQPLEEPVTLEEAAYREMRRVIADGILKPGERLSVNAMAQRMGVSRLPVIHALRRLASEGFIQIRPHKSPTVNHPSAKELRTRSLMMAALEGIAVQEAWPLSPDLLAEMEQYFERSSAHIRAGVFDEQDDWRFHEVVWRAPGVEQLRFTIQTLWDQGAYYRTLGIRAFGATPSRITEHEGILQAFRSGTPEEATARIRSHRLGALHRMLTLFEPDLTGSTVSLNPAAPAPED